MEFIDKDVILSKINEINEKLKAKGIKQLGYSIEDWRIIIIGSEENGDLTEEQLEEMRRSGLLDYARYDGDDDFSYFWIPYKMPKHGFLVDISYKRVL